MTRGTISDYNGFDAQQDCELLRKAMKGLGTDEEMIINIVANRSNAQRQELKKMYGQMWGKDLLKDLKSELSGHFEDVVVALFKPPDEFDAWSLHDAMAGAGTTESTLIEILSSRSNAELKRIIEAYKRLYKKDLSKEVQSETSGYFRRLLFSLTQASRCEGEPLDYAKAEDDANKLFQAGEKVWGTDESRFNQVMASRSFEQLALTFKAYEKISKKTMEQVIKSEMSGDIEDGMLAIVRCAIDKPLYFAERLYKSMKGAGTNDKALIRLMVSRSEIDMVEIKQAFQSKYGKSLDNFIKGDTSGDYRKILLLICEGNTRR